MDPFSFIGNAEIPSIEQLYKVYKKNPESLDESWRNFFKGFEFARANYAETDTSGEVLDEEFKVINLIEWYRKRGHLFTETNPVRTRRQYSPTLDLENFDLSEKDLDTVFQAGKHIGIGPAPLRDIVGHLKQTYCRSIGVEYIFIRKPEVQSWLQHYMESRKNSPQFSNEEKKQIYSHLKRAVGFEQFIHKKFVGQKRFSLEGAESLIPALDAVIEKGAELGIDEFILGMAHRGRLNVLANILKKPYEDIFREFVGTSYDEHIELGDVKYHLGYGNEITTDQGKKVKLKLAPNPSHLEAVGPVVQGISRAKIEHEYHGDMKKLCPIVIHGDAAIAAQGVVYEVIQMSALKGYETGGTIHLVINNQVGFTTNYLEARSSTYCTDIGKVIKAPIFHVNGDDPEALTYTIQLAMEYRQIFHTDVFIDILCYRKYGHNEGDEPRFTQPVLYKAISQHPNPRDIYSKILEEKGIMTPEEIKTEEKVYNDLLEEKLHIAKSNEIVHIQPFMEDAWNDFHHPSAEDFMKSVKTGVNQKKLKEISEIINTPPRDKKVFKKLLKLLDERKKFISENKIDWALGELLAYGSLVSEGYSVRLSGQDSVRGTFSHRHAGYYLEDTAEMHMPLKHVSPDQAPFNVYNSLLSEYGVLGFEYGYALAHPKGLTIWEAQFGDFFNVAQVIIDQYISSAEEKWGLMNGLVLYLPHGYEGQGPEHSSARIERFLSLTAHNNIQIANCTTPANLFHILRRQVMRDFRTPLVLFSPKSLLRHPQCVSTLDELHEGHFQEVIDDKDVDVEDVKRVVFCSGKVYYDLLARKQELEARDIALIRIEQLHPFPYKQLQDIVKKYYNALLHLWVQEEPENMGAWRYIRNEFRGIVLEPLARLASGSPATGLNGLHVMGQKEIMNKVFRHCTCELKNKYCGLQCVDGKSRKEVLKIHKYFESEAKFSI